MPFSKYSSKKRYDNAIKRKVADVQERTSGISRSKQAELSGDMFDEQEFKVQDIPTPKI